ncbi:hypothetical protein [Neorhizobium tomejilense]|uniref:hypothetical protein n=1 Tax=Neorhizobium tomejilense TaxID=2093828 RepID=UPI003ECC5CDE
MATIRQIATRFTVAGLGHVHTATTRFGELVSNGARTAGTAIRNFSSGSVRHIGTVSKAIARVSFKAMLTGGKLAFVGLGTAAVGAAAKIGLISLAAKKATDEMADYLRKLDTLSKQSGESVENIATLRFAAEQNGGDPDELLPTLGTIADQFGEIRKSIEDADAAYNKTSNWSKIGLIAAIKTGDADAASEIISAADAARTGSLTGISDRQAKILQDVQATARGGTVWNRGIASGMSERDLDAAMSRRRLALVTEYKSLEEARKKVEDGFGPTGEALRELEDVGLDMDMALKGGVDTLYALADALDKIPDSNRKLGIAQQLFGEDAGAKNLALLEGGRAAIDRYRRGMEDVSALPTKEDTERGTSLKRSEGRRDMALQGVKLDINRGLSPLMEETNDQLAGWLSRNRTTIAKMVQETFVAVRTVFYDVLKFIEGNDDYQSALFKKGADILKWSRQVIVAVSSIASTTMLEVQKVLSGVDSDWGWLNRVRDAFGWIKALAVDAFSVVTGGQAVNFGWMNEAKAAFTDFMKHVREAWAMFRSVLDGIHAAIKPVLDLFGKDITTAVLFLAMLRFTGILKGVALLGRGLLGIFTPALAGIGTAAAAAAGSVGLITAGFAAAYVASQKLVGYMADQIVEGESKIQDLIAARAKLEDAAYLEKKFASLPDSESKRRFQKYNLGKGYYSGVKLESDQRREDIASYNAGKVQIISSEYGKEATDDEKALAGRWQRGAQERQGVGKVFNVNLSLGGKSAKLSGEGDDGFVAELERMGRSGGNY